MMILLILVGVWFVFHVCGKAILAERQRAQDWQTMAYYLATAAEDTDDDR
jgi:hypothetical protein